jgi:hypothetical protein
MKHIPITENAPIIRTDFSNQRAWDEIVAAVQEPPDPFMFNMTLLEAVTNKGATLDQWPVGGEETDAMPWGAFVSARAHLNAGNEAEAAPGWQSILGQPGLESRHYVQAWHFLRQHGYHLY